MELRKYKLGEIAEILISSIDKKSKEGESPVRLCNFVDVYHNWAITADMVSNFMESTTSEKNIDRFSLKKGYVAFTKDSETRDDIGVPTYIAEDLDNTVLGYHCALVKPDESIISGKYLNAFLHSDYIKRYFELNATGSGMRYTLSVDTLYNIPILAPSLDIQKRIGDLFSNIDRKICINRSLNHYLEAMAKQLYDYWFVQFDFPDEDGKPYKSSGGKMVWNDKLKREIPENWTNATVVQVEKNIITGKTPSTVIEDNFGGPIPFVTIDDIRGNLHVYETARTLSTKGADTQKTKYLPKGSLCCSCIGTVGVLGFIGDIAQTNQQINSIIFSKSFNKEYMYYTLQQHFMYSSAKTGNTILNMSKEEFANIMILYPETSILKKYHNQCEPIFSQIDENIKELNLLTKQRNELLPLLMTGQVSVKQLNNDLPATFIIIRKTSQYEE